MKNIKKKIVLIMQCFAIIAFVAAISVVAVLAAKITVADTSVHVEYSAFNVVGEVSLDWRYVDTRSSGTVTSEWQNVGTVEWRGKDEEAPSVGGVDKRVVRSLSIADVWAGKHADTTAFQMEFRFTFTNTDVDSDGDGYIDKWKVNLNEYPTHANFTAEGDISSASFYVGVGEAVAKTIIYKVNDLEQDASLSTAFKWFIDAC